MSELKIHFLNVGHGDCTIIQFPSGRNMMVDINKAKSLNEEEQKELLESMELSYLEYTNLRKLQEALSTNITSIYEFAKEKKRTLPAPIDPIDYIKNLKINSFFRYVQTHPDMDHMSGLYRLHTQEEIEIINFWDTKNDKVQDFNGHGGRLYDARDWEEYQKLRVSESDPKAFFYYRGDENSYYTEDGITILSPTKELVDKANEKKDYNKLSYVLLIQYGGCKVVLGGDADKEVWEEIICNENLKELLKDVSVLKASHHGRDSCFHEEAVKLMAPQWTVCSVGKKPDNDAHNQYKKYTKNKVLSTRFRGNITLTLKSDGTGTIDWTDNKEE
jgi:competence protein ComEC